MPDSDQSSTTRRCAKCGERKDLKRGFRRKAVMPGGRDRVCRWCRRASEKANYAASLEKLRAKSRRWQRANPGAGKRWKRDNPESLLLANRRLAARRPDRAHAHAAVAAALKRGDIERRACEVCGLFPGVVNGKNRIEAHHDDHSKPLEIRWLCTNHHGKEHRK